MHEIGHVGEHGFDPLDRAVADAEGFQQADGVRPFERGVHLAPVGEQVAVELIGMVEEACAHHHAALDIDQRQFAADALVDLVDAEPELRLATRRDGGRALLFSLADRSGQDAVFQPRAIIGKGREDLPVVQLNRVEIAVRDRQHAFARAAFFYRQHFGEFGKMDHVLPIAVGRGKRGAAVDDALDLVDQPVLDVNAHGVEHRGAVFAHGAEPSRVARGLVRHD